MASAPKSKEITSQTPSQQFYTQFFEMIKKQNTINVEEINTVRAAYPTFAALVRSFRSKEYKSIPELMLSFQLKIHPVASYAIYDYIHVAVLGPASPKWKKQDIFNVKCESDLWRLNQFLSIQKFHMKNKTVSRTTAQSDDI